MADPARAPAAHLDPERRSRLLAVKLGALVRDHTGTAGGEPAPFPGGAALVRDDGAWVLVDERPDDALGAALTWAMGRGVEPLHLLVDHDGPPARQARWFRDPPQVFRIDERRLLVGEPAPLPVPPRLEPELADLRPLIVEAGAEPVEEHGVLAGEVLGLEVCRAVRDPSTGVPRLEVGIGAHDREAFQLLHGDVPTLDALARVVAHVLAVRSDPDALHPLRRLAAARLLRWEVTRHPSRVGLHRLDPAPPPVPRRNLKDPAPAVATGVDADGREVVATFATGIDLSVVPYAADALAAHASGEGVRILVVVPARDAHPTIRRLVGRLTAPAELMAVPPA